MEVPQKIELPYDSEISLLGIYPKQLNAGSERDICITTFIAVLVTLWKKWNQPRCPSVDDCISKMWYIHATEYYSDLNSEEILTPATT